MEVWMKTQQVGLQGQHLYEQQWNLSAKIAGTEPPLSYNPYNVQLILGPLPGPCMLTGSVYFFVSFTSFLAAINGFISYNMLAESIRTRTRTMNVVH